MSTIKTKQPTDNNVQGSLHNGGFILSPGVSALEEKTIIHLCNAVANLIDFYVETDPSGENHTGVMHLDGVPVLFKIADLENDLDLDPSGRDQPWATHRIVILTLAQEEEEEEEEEPTESSNTDLGI